MKKFVLFGDSLLNNFNKELIIKLEGALKVYDVYNCAAGGWDSRDGVKKSGYIASLKPDVVVIGFGTNDAAPWKQVPLEEFEKNVNIILDNFKSSKIIYFLPPPVNEEKEQEDEKRSNVTMKLYHDAAKRICLGKGASIIDSWSIFMPMLTQKKDYHEEDGVHLNDFGYEILIKNMASGIISQHGRK